MLKVKDIIPLIDNNILVRFQSSYEITIPRNSLLKYYGEREVEKITTGTDRNWEEWSNESINKNGSSYKISGSGYKIYKTITLWEKNYVKNGLYKRGVK